MAKHEIAELATEHDHILPRSLYFGIFGILMALTIITVAAAYVDLGNLNIIVAIAIALVKATFVILFFMHVKYSSKLTWLVVASGFVFLAILLAFTMSDIVSRGWLGTPGS